MAALPLHTNSTSATPWTHLPSRILQNSLVTPVTRPRTITRTRSVDLLNLVTGIVIGVVGTVVATRLAQQSLEVSREALALGKWTAMKDWMENCRVEEPACKAALAKGLPPPPFLSETSATDLPVTLTDLHLEPLSMGSIAANPPTTTTETTSSVSYTLSPSLPSSTGSELTDSIGYDIFPPTTDGGTAYLPISVSHTVLPIETSTDTSQWPAQTILPTGTDIATSQWLPPTMVAVQPDTPSEPTGTPPSLPKAIAPGGGISRQPCNTTTIQIGFNYRLPYPFIVENSIAAAQIFAFIPAAIAYGLDIPEDKVVVRMLVPYDTTKELGYITTLAICFIAIDLVDRLALDLQTPHSKLFQNPLSSVSSLVDLIDISFPILAEEHLVSSPSRDQAEAGSQLPPGTVLEVQNPDPRFLNVIVFSTVVAILIYTATMVAVSRRYWAQKSRWRVPLSFETIKQEQRQSGQLTAKPEAHQETSWINK